MRSNRVPKSFFQDCLKVTVPMLVFCLAVGPTLIFSSSRGVDAHGDSSKPAQQPQTVKQQSGKPQRVFAPHWTTEDGFQTLVYIRNVHIERAVTTRLSLVLDHRTITLALTHIEPLQTISIDVAKALAENGEKTEQSGGATIDFEAESAGQINAYAQILDTTRSLGFSFPFSPDGSSAPGPLEAVALYYGKNTDAFIAFQNTTDKEAIALPTVFVSGRVITLGKKPLKPHEAATIKLPSVDRSSSTSSPVEGPQSVGVRVEYEGNPGAVVAQGWVMDERIGFSAPFSFHHKSSCNCADDLKHLYGAGIMIGAGGMGSGIVFSPYIVTRNNSEERMIVSPVFTFEVNGTVERVTLPGVVLGRQETTVINLRKYQEDGILPLSVEMGDIDLQYKGEPGALVAELASVNQNGSFVSPVPLTCNGNPDQHMVFWRTDGDWHSSITIENIAANGGALEITISYPNGIYVLERDISPHKTIMLSINELQRSQEPDSAGRRIPLDATLGGVNIWSRDLKNGLVINAMLVNPVTKTCGQCGTDGYVSSAFPTEDYQPCQTASGFQVHQVGDQFGLQIVLVFTSGTRVCDLPNYSTVISYNPSVANLSGSNLVCYGPGDTYITAYTEGLWPTDSSCLSYHTILGNGLFSPVIQPKIKQDGIDITGTTHDVIVGQRISLTFEILPAGTPTTRNRWTIPPNAIANYVASATSATVTPLSDLQNPSVVFYWVDGGDGRQVQFSFKVNGIVFTVSATLNVKRPAFNVTTSTGSIAIRLEDDGRCFLRFGNPTTHGIDFSRSAIPQGFSGTAQWVQIGDPHATFKDTNNICWSLSGAGLDTSYPYGTDPIEQDNPGVSLDDTLLTQTVNDDFDMWLLFMPAGTDSIWVPIKKVHWGFSAAATRNGSGCPAWVVTSSTVKPVTVTDSIQHPVWTQLLNCCTYSQVTCQ